MYCDKCGAKSISGSYFCSNCGGEITSGLNKSNSELNNTEFYEVFLGQNNQDYYLKHFSNFDKNGKVGVTWHWPAFFITFYWLLYRKMWLNSFLYFILPYILALPLAIIAALIGDNGIGIALIYMVYLAIIFFLPPMYANALYYKHSKKIIQATKQSTNDRQRQFGVLSAKGGTGSAVLVVVLIFGFIFFIGILAAIAIPAYQDYIVRAKIAEGINISNEAKIAVIDSVNSNEGVLPIDNFAADYIYKDKSPNVREVLIENGVVIIIMGIEPINGGSIIQAPTEGADNNIAWSCYSPDIDNKYLPIKCRQ